MKSSTTLKVSKQALDFNIEQKILKYSLMSAVTHDLCWDVHNKGHRTPQPLPKKRQCEATDIHCIILNLHWNPPYDPKS